MEVKDLKEYATINKVPIMQDEGINYLCNFIKNNNINTLLEIGTAIGYSAIMMALTNTNLKITTIERDEKRFKEAIKNIKEFNLEDRITVIYQDALDIDIESCYDLVFIDAAKGQNKKFFLKFSNNLNKPGYIITDNINFHGFVDNPEVIRSKNLRQLVRKIKEYIEFLKENKDYVTEFLDIGDGLAVSYKK